MLQQRRVELANHSIQHTIKLNTNVLGVFSGILKPVPEGYRREKDNW
jgi:hypothetical protein